MLVILLAVILWATCGYINWGYTMGYFSHAYPAANHTGVATIAAIAGPVGLLPSLTNVPHHWRVKPMTVEERWEEFHRESPLLSREYFERNYN